MGNPIEIEVAGERVRLHPDRALEWGSVLFVADVHLGKSAVFRAAGLPVPGGELAEDLQRLSRLVADVRPQRLIVVGDLIHGALAPSVIDEVAAWRSALPCVWGVVRGNHDRHEKTWPNAWKITDYAAGQREGPFVLHHEPVSCAGATVLCGHVHPVVRAGRGRDSLRFPAFVVEDGSLLLPAFTQFSGGRAISSAPGRRRYGCSPDAMLVMDEA